MNDAEFRDCIHKYRDELATPLHFQPSIELLLDTDFCEGLDRVVHSFDDARWERRLAVSDLGPSLPDQRGLYLFVWRPSFALRFAAEPNVERVSWILYVGKAGTAGAHRDTIRYRYLNEYRKYVGGDPSRLWTATEVTGREERLAMYLALRPLEYWFLLIDDPSDILLLERKLIKIFGPPLNRQQGVRIRPGKPRPAFEEPK